MNRLISVLASWAVVPAIIIFGGHRISSQSPADKRSSSGLELLVELDKPTYRLVDDTVRMRLSFKNVSDAPIALYTDMGWGPASSLTLIITDGEGNAMQPEVLSDAKDRLPLARKSFRTLQPGGHFRFSRLISLETEGVKKTGPFRLTVEYHCPVTKETLPEGIQDAWTADRGGLSRTVPFSVTDR